MSVCNVHFPRSFYHNNYVSSRGNRMLLAVFVMDPHSPFQSRIQGIIITSDTLRLFRRILNETTVLHLCGGGLLTVECKALIIAPVLFKQVIFLEFILFLLSSYSLIEYSTLFSDVICWLNESADIAFRISLVVEKCSC